MTQAEVLRRARKTKTIFTQGPWGCDESHTNAISIIAGRREIASVYEEKKRDVDDEMRANARLIASAPELLANLKNILSCANAIVGADPSDPEATEAFDMFDDARRKARAAIVKATGA